MEKMLSVVVSVYNEEQALPIFYQTAKPILDRLSWNYELWFMNDGSQDDSLKVLLELAAQDDHVKVVSFSRNFGHEAAMIAGIDYARGDGIVCMDADLQHPPSCLPEIVEKLVPLAPYLRIKYSSSAARSFSDIPSFISESSALNALSVISHAFLSASSSYGCFTDISSMNACSLSTISIPASAKRFHSV